MGSGVSDVWTNAVSSFPEQCKEALNEWEYGNQEKYPSPAIGIWQVYGQL